VELGDEAAPEVSGLSALLEATEAADRSYYPTGQLMTSWEDAKAGIDPDGFPLPGDEAFRPLDPPDDGSVASAYAGFLKDGL